MIIVEINGGFASQLQKYALGYGIAKAKKTELCLNVSSYMKGYFRPFVLNAFKLPNCLLLNDNTILLKAKWLNSGKDLLEAYENWDYDIDYYIYGEESNYDFFLDKYTQFRMNNYNSVYKYLELKEKSDFINNFRKVIKDHVSIGVHLRLGDFKTMEIVEPYEFYKAAIGCLLINNPDADVFFFSNDIETVKKEFGCYHKFYYIDNKNGFIGDLEDFLCLSMCKEKIISVKSTYSRYATQLGIQIYGSHKAIAYRDIANMDESIRILDPNDYNSGLLFYENMIKPTEVGGYNVISSALPNIGYDTLICHETLFSSDDKTKYWKQFYNIDYIPDEVIVIDDEKYNKWYYSAHFTQAMIYSRLGSKVLYIGIGRSFEDTNHIIRAKNMDGKDLGFDMYISNRRLFRFSRIINSWRNDEFKPSFQYMVIRESLKKRIDIFGKKLLSKLSGCNYLDDRTNKVIPNSFYDLDKIVDLSIKYEKVVMHACN